jgi:hypothetical protein
LTIDIAAEQIEALNRYAAARGIATSSLLREYVTYLLAGGEPLGVSEPSADDLTCLAAEGGAFDWLQDEPDLYRPIDGEPV